MVKRIFKKIKRMQPMEGIQQEIRKTKEEFGKTITTLLLGGFGLVAALAWNDAIQTIFNEIFPKESSGHIIGKFFYAITITVIVVIISLQLKKISEKQE
jgi:uncharacterized BrkB/YihY/UPF0761 family membrane protein